MEPIDPSDYVLEMRGIRKSFFGVQALDGVQLKVRRGTVHVLVGENGAGKSTLMKVLSGEHSIDEGEIRFNGQPLIAQDTKAALESGIAMIHQELSPVLDMTIAENIFLGREPMYGPLNLFVDFRAMESQTQGLLDRLGFRYSATQPMRELSIAGMQMIEIAKAVSRSASLVIMDEPTSAISDTEVAMLFRQIAELKTSGVAIIYITHKMDEIFRIADDITVIRDGQYIDANVASAYDESRLISQMVGRTISSIFPKEDVPIGDVALEVRGLTRRGVFEDISFSVRKGEIVGPCIRPATVRAASAAALGFAKKHGTLRVLDIDYRPVLWGLTKRGEGDNRFVADERVTASLQEMLPQFDLLIGTEEEFLIAGGVPDDLIASLRRVRVISRAAFVVKLGARGCAFVPGEVPDRIEDAEIAQGERVEVMNVLGAGDAFAAGLLTGFLNGESFAGAARIANACGAIVVSRHACAPAMPTPAELAHWFSGSRNPKVDADEQLAHLHRTTPASRPRWPQLNVIAFDHRAQFAELAQQAGADENRIPVLKGLLLRAAEQSQRQCGLRGSFGVLIDGSAYGQAALHAATGRGWWVGRPVERPGSRPLRWDAAHSIASSLADWPREQTVKCLVLYHPDDAAQLRAEQEERIRELWEATRASGHELLLEVIPPKQPAGEGDPAAAAERAVLRSVERFYALGFKPEWWKLAPMSGHGWAALAALVRAHDPQCRGAVVLGLNQPLEVLAAGFAQATHPIVKGFMVGRTLWAAPSLAWLKGEIDDSGLIDQVTCSFTTLVAAWRDSRALRQEAA